MKKMEIKLIFCYYGEMPTVMKKNLIIIKSIIA